MSYAFIKKKDPPSLVHLVCSTLGQIQLLMRIGYRIISTITYSRSSCGLLRLPPKSRALMEITQQDIITSPDYVLLFHDEKGPIAAKTYGGSLWCSAQAKIEHDQKVKGLLNVFGIYDYTNDRMLTHCYQQKKSDQFIGFIGRLI
jgi:hypothetical protein